MSGDDRTLGVYDQRAADYAKAFSGTEMTGLRAFLEALPGNAHVLDLGCGPGNAAAALAAAGHSVDAVDGSAEMVAHARAAFGLEARQARFEDVAGEDLYDGIWANFSLLHAPKSEMPDHLARLSRALRPGGVFHIGMKTGTGEKRDGIGRFYAYYGEDELEGLLRDAGLTPVSRVTGADKGLDGTVAPWVVIRARG